MSSDIDFFENILNTAIEAAKAAGQEAINAITNTNVSIKNGNEIVTQMDPICQQIIIDRIKSQYPDHGILAEEGEDGQLLKCSPTGDSDIWWVIDPIDGTNNYAHQIMNFTVSVAVLQGGRPKVAVIYYPATGNVFSAIVGKGTYVDGRKIEQLDEEISKYAHISIDSHWPNGIPEPIIDLIQKVRFRNLGTSALHLAYVAGGSLVAAITNTTKLWDIAAGVLLIEEAGGKITDWEGTPFFPIDPEQYNNEYLKVAAGNPVAYKQILETLQKTDLIHN